jgi:prepilin-type processing-associated H-X9-DG protein/prepilin-type N-terminal cleavage/methylation domain-containing protein
MKRAFTLVEAVIVLAIILILAAILFPVFARYNERPYSRNSCQSNLKQIGLGLIQYSQDYNEFLPTTSIGASGGWADATYPYTKTWIIFQCRGTVSQTTPTIDYFFNGRLSRAYLPKLNYPANTIMAGDGQDNAPTWANQSHLPSQWLADQSSPSWRHLVDKGNYLFADGHVKALTPSAISNLSPNTVKATFAVR